MKKILSTLLAVTLMFGVCATSVSAATNDVTLGNPDVRIYNEDGDLVCKTTYDGSTMEADVYFGETIYISLSDVIASSGINLKDMTNTSKTNFSTRKTENGSYVTNIDLVTEKLRGLDRDTYIKVDLKGSTKVEDYRTVEFEAAFKAKKDGSMTDDMYVGDKYVSNFVLNLSQNETSNGDFEVEQGGVYTPDQGYENYISWNDRGTLVSDFTYDASNNADGFYVKLSIFMDEEFYAKYAKPADEDILIRYFGNVRVPGTTRGDLALYNTFSDYAKPANCVIYKVDGDEWTDVTESFIYKDGAWVTKTATLGNYVIATGNLFEDEAPTSSSDETPQETPADNTTNKPSAGIKDNPHTGI